MAKKKQKAKVKSTKAKTVASKSISLPVMPKLANLPKLDKNKVLIGAGVLTVLAFLYLFKGLFVAAIVNGTPITRVALIQELDNQHGSQVLTSLIEKELIAEEARKQNVVVTQDEVNAEISKIEELIKSQGQTLDEALAAEKFTRARLEDQLRTQLTIEKLLADKIKVTDQEIEEYMKDDPTQAPRESVAEMLRQRKLGTEYTTWIAGLMAASKIQYWVNF